MSDGRAPRDDLMWENFILGKMPAFILAKDC